MNDIEAFIESINNFAHTVTTYAPVIAMIAAFVGVMAVGAFAMTRVACASK